MAHERDENDAADQLEQEVAERDAARLRRRTERRQHAEDAAAEIGAEHETEGDGKRQHLKACKRREQQDDREARIAQHRQQRRDEHVEQHVAGQRREDHLDARGLDDGLGGDRDPLQREHDEPEADQDATEASDLRALSRQEQHDADEDQQWREPRQIERQHERDQRGADIGAEHHR
jgi:hypothetical protein